MIGIRAQLFFELARARSAGRYREEKARRRSERQVHSDRLPAVRRSRPWHLSDAGWWPPTWLCPPYRLPFAGSRSASMDRLRSPSRKDRLLRLWPVNFPGALKAVATVTSPDRKETSESGSLRPSAVPLLQIQCWNRAQSFLLFRSLLALASRSPSSYSARPKKPQATPLRGERSSPLLNASRASAYRSRR